MKDEWWGFSPEHGWVVLDRKIATNRPGKGGKLIFLRCRDWTHYKEDRKKWDPPYYYFENQYLKSLTEKDAFDARTILNGLKDECKHKKEEFYSSVVRELHSQFLEKAGRAAPETKKAINKNRASYCWNCKQPVDNSVDLECSACGWIICGNCGACGCTYGGSPGRHQESERYKEVPPDKEPLITMQGAVFQTFREANEYAKKNPGSKLTRTNDGNAWKVE